MKLIKFVFCLIFLALPVLAKIDTVISYDLDETLIESDKLLDKHVDDAKKLGFEVRKTKTGREYIVRPGAVELLKFTKQEGFDIYLFTLNSRSYAEDILQDSGMDKYFTRIISREDCVQDYNDDFETYPNHRNKLHYPNSKPIKSFFKALNDGLFKRGVQRLAGNRNIKPFVPCTSCDKYPPAYGTRVLIDNAEYNVENSDDFVGILVDDFYGNKLEAKNSAGKYLWAETVKANLRDIKALGWEKFYKKYFKKAPLETEIKYLR